MKNVLITAFDAAPRGTQTRIAEQLGVRVTAVNKWAKGYNIPEPQHWARLEQLLDLPAGTFTPLANEGSPSEVMTMLRAISARLDVVEQTLGLRAHAQSGPSDRQAP